MLKRGDECQPCALAKGGELEGVRVGWKGARIRDRLEPVRTWTCVERIVHGADRAFVHGTGTTGAIAQGIEAHIGGDPIQPRPQRSPAVEAVQAAPGTHHRVLDRIFRIEGRAQHAVAMPGQRRAMRFQLACVQRHLNS